MIRLRPARRPQPMHLLALTTLAALALAPSLAIAQDEEEAAPPSDEGLGIYIEYQAGVTHVPYQTIHGDRDTNSILYGRSEQKDAAYNLGLAIGVPVNDSIRGEIAVNYRDSEFTALAVGPEPDEILRDGSIAVLTVMANGYYDFDLDALAGIDTPITPWVGFGIGWGFVDFDGENMNLGIDDNADTFAFNAMMGASVEITDILTLNFGYRYVRTADFTLNGYYDTVGDAPDAGFQKNRFDYEFDAHEGFAGLRFAF